jgi:hypothetical protein
VVNGDFTRYGCVRNEAELRLRQGFYGGSGAHCFGDNGSRGGKIAPLRHSFNLASRLALASAVKSGKAFCACLAQLSAIFHLVRAWLPSRLDA